jgi:hypothetical protein
MQNTATKMYEKNSLVFYQDIKHKWGGKAYVECCTRHEMNAID